MSTGANLAAPTHVESRNDILAWEALIMPEMLGIQGLHKLYLPIAKNHGQSFAYRSS